MSATLCTQAAEDGTRMPAQSSSTTLSKLWKNNLSKVHQKSQ